MPIKRLLLTATLLALALPDPVLATTVQGEDIGKNLGDLLAGWAAAVFSGTVGLVALIFLLQRPSAHRVTGHAMESAHPGHLAAHSVGV